MKRAVAVAVLLACSFSYAEEEQLVQPLDAPLAYRVLEGTAIIDEGSSVYLGPGLYLNDTAAMLLAQKVAGYKAENETYKEALEQASAPPPSLLLLLGAALLGAAASYGAVRLLSK